MATILATFGIGHGWRVFGRVVQGLATVGRPGAVGAIRAGYRPTDHGDQATRHVK
jgi:hypothetical protein